MTNEWNEFLAYTQPVTYAAFSKRDTTYLGRMTFATIQEQEGLSRIFTILARGYLYHDANGERLPDLVNEKGEGWFYRQLEKAGTAASGSDLCSKHKRRMGSAI